MWLIAQYEATTLFTLKSSLATSSAGKTLLVPTPFSLKMALLDVSLRTNGLERGQLDFAWLRDMSIAVKLPEQAVVTNLFAKIQKPRRFDKKKGSDDKGVVIPEGEDEEDANSAGPFGPTIAYREYVHYQGRFGLAFEIQPDFRQDQVKILSELLMQLNYLGKRGSFFQLVELPYSEATLPAYFISLTQEGGTIPFNGLLQVLDDCGSDLTFDKVNIYSDKKIKLGNERQLRSIVIPYQLARSSRTYSLYRRID